MDRVEVRLETGTSAGCVVVVDARRVTVERPGPLRWSKQHWDLEHIAAVRLVYGLRCRLVAGLRDGGEEVLVRGGRPRHLAWLRDLIDEAAFRRRRSLGAVDIPTVPPSLERLRGHPGDVG